MPDGEKQRRRISDAFIPFPSSFKRNYKRSKVNRVWQYCSCSEILPQATCNINFDTEPKREFEKYPQVKLLILAERVLVTVDPLRQGHGVKTQHWNWALINSSNDLSPHESLLPVTARVGVSLIIIYPANLWGGGGAKLWYFTDK